MDNNILMQLLNATFVNSKDMVWIKDLDGRHIEFNNAFLNALPRTKDGHKKTREECLNQEHNFLWEITEDDGQQSENICIESEKEVIKAKKSMIFYEDIIVGDGNLRNLETVKTPIYDESGKHIIGTIGIARDITTECRYKNMLEEQSIIDPLTRLYNRRYFFRVLNQMKDEEITLIFMDLDNFKYINDTYGHSVGDEVLKLAADTMTKTLDKYEICRFGGDEFVAIRKGIEENEKCNELISALKNVWNSNDKFKELGISIGVAHKSANETDVNSVLHQADEKMYERKRRVHAWRKI